MNNNNRIYKKKKEMVYAIIIYPMLRLIILIIINIIINCTSSRCCCFLGLFYYVVKLGRARFPGCKVKIRENWPGACDHFVIRRDIPTTYFAIIYTVLSMSIRYLLSLWKKDGKKERESSLCYR